MNEALTQSLAVWGALLSTVVFCWEIFKWRRDQVRLVVKAEFEDFGSDEFIRVIIQNRGGKQTTLSNVVLECWKGGFFGKYCTEKSRENIALKYRDNPPLPVKFESGAGGVSPDGQGSG